MSPLLSTFAGDAARAYGMFGAGGGAAGSYELISTTILGSTTSQIDFTSIPQIYKHLQVRMVIRDTTSGFQIVEKIGFNNDTSTIYDTHNLQADGSSVISNNALNQDTIQHMRAAGSSATANIFSAAVVDILDYTSTNKNKVTRSFYGSPTNSSPEVALRSGSWRNTAAITSLKIYTGGAATGSRFSLYGIRG